MKIVKQLRSKRAALALALLAATLQTNSFADGSSIGDLPGYGEDTYFAADAAYDESSHEMDADGYFADDVATDTDRADFGRGDTGVIGSGYQESTYQETEYQDNVRSVQFVEAPMAGYHTGSSAPVYNDGGTYVVGSHCDAMPGGCDSLSGSGGRGNSVCQGNMWATGEALLWFIEDRQTVPLAIGFDDDTIDANEQVFESLTNFDSGLSPGFRVDAGSWISENVGLGGRFTQIYDGGSDGLFEVDDSRGIGVPFFNPDFGSDLLLIRADGIRQGELAFDEELDFWMAEAYGRLRLTAECTHSLDLIGGYSHIELDNSLGLETRGLVAIDNTILPAGTRQFFRDDFEATNSFDGGQIGFEAVMTRGRFMARSLTKVHLGNMSQSLSRSGRGSQVDPSGLGGVTDLGGGIFGPSPRQSVERDVFAFIPEANFKLGFSLTNNATLTAGYSFLYVDNVALAGSAINPVVSPPGAPFENGPSLATINDDSLFIHGVDVGLVLDF